MEYPAREDFDGIWNFIYMAYSEEMKEVFAYGYFGYSDLGIPMTWPD